MAHRDLKPENILVCSQTYTLKICDFGFAESFGHDTVATKCVGTRGYIAPELQ